MKKVKDLFYVEDGSEEDTRGVAYPKFRLSEAMTANAAILIVSILIGIGVDEVEAAAIATAVMAILGMLLRLRSTGGEVKLKKEIQTNE